MCLTPYANNKGADQPAISKASVAEQAGLNLACSKIPEDTFSRDVAHFPLRIDAFY